MKIQTIVMSLCIAALSLQIGCGPRSPSLPVDGEVINPRVAFNEGVRILGSPDRQGNVDYESAYAFFSAAVQVQPDMATGQFNAGWTAERLGRIAQAEQHYQQALAADTSYRAALFSLVSVLTRLDRGAEAVEIFSTYVENNPDDQEARASYTDALIAAEMYDDALGEIRTTLSVDAENLQAYQSLSQLYFDQGRYAMSQLCADKALSLAEDSASAGMHNNQGVTHLVLGKETAAIRAFQQTLELDPSHLEANRNLGWIALRSGDYTLAHTCFERALQSDPGNTDSRLCIAITLRQRGEFDEAERIYDQVIVAEPENRIAYFNAAILQERYIRDFSRASRYLQTYVDSVLNGVADDDTLDLMAQVEQSRQLEEERQAEEEAARVAAQERAERQQQMLVDLTTRISELEGLISQYGTCATVIEAGHAEMGTMLVQQANDVAAMENADMAAQVLPFLTQTITAITDLGPECPDPSAAPPPAPEGTQDDQNAEETAPEASPEADTETPVEE